MKKPWLKRSTLTWYWTAPNGKQVPLGKDPRYSREKPPPKGLKDPPEAVRRKYHRLAQLDAVPEDRTIGFVCDQYLRSMGEYAKGTRKVTRLHLKWFLADVGENLRASKLKPHHVTAHLELHPKWSKGMRRAAIAKIKAALNHGVKEGWIEANPLAAMKKPASSRRTAIITPEEQRLLEAAAVPEFRNVLIALRESGCRPNEIANATIDRLDLEAGTLAVKNKTAGATGHLWRTVYLSPTLLELCRRLKGDRDEGHLFLNCEGKPWTSNTLTTRMWKLRKKLALGEHCILYAYRHKFASDAINNANVNPAHVARQLGHQDLTMLLRHYFHEDPGAMRRAIAEATKEG